MAFFRQVRSFANRNFDKEIVGQFREVSLLNLMNLTHCMFEVEPFGNSARAIR